MVAVSRRGTAAPGAVDVRADALDPDALRPVLEGADAVVLAIGGSKGSPRHRERVTAAVLAALPPQEPHVIVHSSLGVGDTDRFLPPGIRAVVKMALGAALADHEAQEQLVRASGLPWTMVRPGGLTDAPAAGGYVALEQPGPLQWRLSRGDVASFILDCAEDPATAGHAYALGTPRA